MNLALELFQLMNNAEFAGCNVCREYITSPETFSVMTHDSKQAVVTFNFCPSCGRRLPAILKQRL